MFKELARHHFLFNELVKRDFKRKYKRTYLGVAWSMLGPLLQLTAMALIFTQLFGNTTPHFIVYLFAGNLVFTFFSQSTKAGMTALKANANIINNVHAPKWVFLLSTNVAALINFLLTLALFFFFALFEGLLCASENRGAAARVDLNIAERGIVGDELELLIIDGWNYY